MKRYFVIFEDSAQIDVRQSYEWGCRAWGKPASQAWLRHLRTDVRDQLAVIPKGYPLAPEDVEFEEEVRQMILGRYRVLFTIRRRAVHVLHVRGAYVGSVRSDSYDS